MRPVALAVVLALLPTVGMAENANYRNCVDWLEHDPNRALRDAEGWRDAGGGLAARHCRALALATLGRFGEAAAESQSVAAEMPPSEARLDALISAGEYYMSAGDPYSARQAFDQALTDVPNNTEALESRARSLAAAGDMSAAMNDLNQLLSIAPGNVEALTLRAAAKRRSGDAAGALADADTALQYDPGSAISYFERGAARAVTGDTGGAQSDWQTAASLDPGGPAGELASANLARLSQ